MNVPFIVYLCSQMGFLHPLYSDSPRPERFTYPFCYEPHPLCEMAAKEVQAYIASHAEIREDADKGKMFGVLVVKMDDGRGLMEEEPAYGFLAAYSRGGMTGIISYHPSMTPSSLTDTLRRRSGRYLKHQPSAIKHQNRCRRSCKRGCFTSTSC